MGNFSGFTVRNGDPMVDWADDVCLMVWRHGSFNCPTIHCFVVSHLFGDPYGIYFRSVQLTVNATFVTANRRELHQ